MIFVLLLLLLHLEGYGKLTKKQHLFVTDAAVDVFPQDWPRGSGLTNWHGKK